MVFLGLSHTTLINDTPAGKFLEPNSKNRFDA
jgi:hypothetical protein